MTLEVRVRAVIHKPVKIGGVSKVVVGKRHADGKVR